MMHDGMLYDPIQCQGHKPFNIGNPAIFESYLLCHGFLNYGTISKFDRTRVLIFVLVSLSRDFELGRNVSFEESTVSPDWS